MRYQIRCPYFVPGVAEPCRVIAALDHPLPHAQQLRLKSRFCNGGVFVACPLYRLIQRGLDRFSELRAAQAI